MPWCSTSSAAAGRSSAAADRSCANAVAGRATSAATAPAPSASPSRRLTRIPSIAIADFTGVCLSLTGAGLGRLRLVPPPDGGKIGDPVFRHRIGMAEAIPARGALLVEGELRHHVVVPQQHAVERVGGGDELVPVLCKDHLVDQRIDRGILDADIVLR